MKIRAYVTRIFKYFVIFAWAHNSQIDQGDLPSVRFQSFIESPPF